MNLGGFEVFVIHNGGWIFLISYDLTHFGRIILRNDGCCNELLRALQNVCRNDSETLKLDFSLGSTKCEQFFDAELSS